MDRAPPRPTVAIMQPYLFPYIGYFQLIAQADTFVAYDDAQFIKNGWSNRNRILVAGEPHFFTIPVAAGPHDGTYAERRYALTDRLRSKLLRTIEQAYASAPHKAETLELVAEALSFADLSVAAFNRNAVELVCRRIGIDTPIVRSSSLPIAPGLHGQDRVIAICSALGAGRYLNSFGGFHLYDAATFAAHGLDLMFTAPEPIEYDQSGGEPVAGLSIIDALMFNSVDTVRAMLWRSYLIRPQRPTVAEPMFLGA